MHTYIVQDPLQQGRSNQEAQVVRALAHLECGTTQYKIAESWQAKETDPELLQRFIFWRVAKTAPHLSMVIMERLSNPDFACTVRTLPGLGVTANQGHEP